MEGTEMYVLPSGKNNG